MTINPSADRFVEPKEDVILTLAARTGYTLSSPIAATGNITNDDSSTVRVFVDLDRITEDVAGNRIFTFTRSNTSSQTPALTANFSIGGTAERGTDYTLGD